MKEKISNFFKKNWIVLAIFGLALLLFVLGFLSAYLIVAGSLILGLLCYYLMAKYKSKYNEAKKVDPSKDYFDARSLDYDEDVYYIGENEKKSRMESSWARFKTLSPTILYGVVGTMLIAFGLALLFRYLI